MIKLFKFPKGISLGITDFIHQDDFSKVSRPSAQAIWSRVEELCTKYNCKPLCTFDDMCKEYPEAMRAVFVKHTWSY